MRRLLLLAVFLATLQPALAEDTSAGAVTLPADHPEMAAAIAKARESLPSFWERFHKPMVGDAMFSIKVRIADGEISELIWCDDINGPPEKPSCILVDTPNLVKNVKEGSRIEVASDMIADWMFMADGKIAGGQTIRAMLPHMDAEEAEYLRGRLADE